MAGCELTSNVDVIKNSILEFSDKAILNNSPSDMGEAAKQLWAEIKPQLCRQIDNELKKLFDEYKTTENITKLLQLRRQFKDKPSWMFSGEPDQDIAALRNVTAKSVEPAFGKVLSEVETASTRLYDICKRLNETVASLDKQISELSEEIEVLTNQNSSY